jgi:hypothetical protein
VTVNSGRTISVLGVPTRATLPEAAVIPRYR